MKKLGIPPVKLHAESLVFLGGGWKGHADKQIDKKDLYQLAEEMLGIPNARLRDGFGSVEHCIPYIECKNHEFHVPVYSRVFIRDVESLQVLSFNEKGFLHFVSPYITSMPPIQSLWEIWLHCILELIVVVDFKRHFLEYTEELGYLKIKVVR